MVFCVLKTCCFLLLWTFAVQGLHLHGTWKTSEFLKVLAKFGFQRTNIHDRLNTQGYIFGNITSKSTIENAATLLVVDKRYFQEFYDNSAIRNRGLACPSMFKAIDKIAYDSACHQTGVEDFIRKIPCKTNNVCIDEDQPSRVVSGFQFTYGVQDISQPRFWFISLVSCHRTSVSANCTWMYDENLDIEVEYDIWLVNGNPYTRHQNPFEYQFSFDKQDTVEIYLAFLLLYLALMSVQIYAMLRQHHPLTRLLTCTIGMALIGSFVHFVHAIRFAFDGLGVEELNITGDIFDILSRAFFILILLLLAKGWAVTHSSITWKPFLFFVWGMYLVANIVLYVALQTTIDVIEDVDEYKTWPGWLTLGFRMLIMIWFLYELRCTMCREPNKQKLQFFLHFGASSLVWFISLPIVAVVSLNVSALWRFKLLLGTSYLVNYLAFASVTHLLWPTRSEQYSHLIGAESDAGDELEEFNEAPHVLNQKGARI